MLHTDLALWTYGLCTCTGLCTQKGPTLDLMFSCCLLEILNNFEQEAFYFHFALHLANYVAGPHRRYSSPHKLCSWSCPHGPQFEKTLQQGFDLRLQSSTSERVRELSIDQSDFKSARIKSLQQLNKITLHNFILGLFFFLKEFPQQICFQRQSPEREVATVEGNSFLGTVTAGTGNYLCKEKIKKKVGRKKKKSRDLKNNVRRQN